MHALPRGFEDRAHERDGRALAVGTGDVDHRWQAPFRMAERGEEALDAAEREIDALRVQRQQSGEDGLPALLPRLVRGGGARASAGARRAHAGAGRLKCGCGRLAAGAAAVGAFISSWQSRAMVARRSWRCTTMSTMPWSRRYSAL